MGKRHGPGGACAARHGVQRPEAAVALTDARGFAALAQTEHPQGLLAVVRTALGLAAEICVYTNTHLRVETLGKAEA